jgi:hypothetical protein
MLQVNVAACAPNAAPAAAPGRQQQQQAADSTQQAENKTHVGETSWDPRHI